MNQYNNRGMPFDGEGTNSSNMTIYASARDVGNYGAAYMPAKFGFSWEAERFVFDFYQKGIEGQATQQAQRAGFNAGNSRWNTQPSFDSSHIMP